jgi:hypothetical protein
MIRDIKLKQAFETIDDSLTGVLGYSHYSMATFYGSQANDQQILQYLPKPAMQITHEWARIFNEGQLVSVMRSMYEPFSARLGLVLVVSCLEPGLKRMMERIVQQRKDLKNVPKYYKLKLKWAFNKITASTYGTLTMIQRVPELCLDIDHARRLRNLFVHNNGLFNQRYADDALVILGKQAILQGDFTKFKEDPTQRVPVLVSLNEFRKMAYSHIEFNHNLHDALQREYFGCTELYSYAHEKKAIEWHRLLTGQ